MFSFRSTLPIRAGFTALSVISVSECEGQTTTSGLDYQQIITCNVAVETHFRGISFAAFKRHDGSGEVIQREEMAQRRAWLSLAASRGKSPEEVDRDLIAERLKRTADGHQAELDRLQDLYLKSEPSLRLTPYYKPLSAKEREDVRARQHAIITAADQQNEIRYRQCLSALR